MAGHPLTRRQLLAQAGSLAAVGYTAPRPEATAAQGAGPREGVTPFRIDIPRARIDRIMAELRDVEWPDAPEDRDPWAYGTSLAVMKDLVHHWRTKYDWNARQARINRLPQFKARVDDYDIHFVHLR